MKFLKQTFTAALMLCVMAVGALAFEPQKNDPKGPPPKDPKVVEKPDKPPPPRDDKRNDNRGQDRRGNRP
jgi:hypothetical protein